MSESQVRSILLTDWDPIGLREIPDFAVANSDEYDRYGAVVCAMLRDKSTQADLEHYLRSIELTILGKMLPIQQTQAVAQKLLSLSG